MKLKDGRSGVELISYASVNKNQIIDQYLGWMNNIEVVQYFGSLNLLFPKKKSFIEESFRRFTTDETIGFFIYDKTENQFVGTCKLGNICLINRSAEIGVMIGETNVHGQGIGRKTTKILMDYAFQTLGLHRVWTTVYSNNRGAQKVMEKLGLSLEGRLRESVFKKGEYIDQLRYGILNKEYNPNNNTNTHAKKNITKISEFHNAPA